MRVALVHDYLREYGGAERVVECLHEMFPEAPVYTAYFRPEGLGPHAERLKEWDIRTSWLQKVPFANRLVSPLRILAPLMFQSFDLSSYDVVISSSSIYFAKAVKTQPHTLHLAYIHTPPRYLYGYVTSYNYKKHWWTKVGGEIANHFLRIWDFQSSQTPDILVTNSKNVQERIRKFYRREAVVVYPHVDIEEFKEVEKKPGTYFLSLGRLVRGKYLEVVVEACTKLRIPLKVAGSGSQLEYLKSIAGPTVEFVGHVKDEEKAALYAGAKALIVCEEDVDFGITPVEAMAAGTPVIATPVGGYLETVIPGKTGEFMKGFNGQPTVESLIQTLQDFDPQKYKAEDCKKQGAKFSKERFKKEILEVIDENLR